jgi:hypothetical protein
MLGCPAIQPPPGGDTGDDDDEPDPNSGITGKFIGSTICDLCHSGIHDNWAETLHGDALASLKSIGQDTNAACLPCHTVGFGEEGGYVDEETTLDLANVGCESCHGPSREHVENVQDESKRPPTNIASEVCGECHTGSHHPHIDEWETSAHAEVTGFLATAFSNGERLNACGECHSGDFFYKARVQNETVTDDELQGVAVEELNAVECAVCHDPHMRTNNGVDVADGRDFQLRFPEVANPTPTNTVDQATNAARFNLCGQCHHSRGKTWEVTSRGPHHSVQANMFTGEMPVPEDTEPLVSSRISIHSFAEEQCATCHLYRQDFMSELAPAIAGHTFEVNDLSCATANCHPSQAQAETAQTTLQSEVQTRLDGIAAGLGDPSTWQYTADGGPDADGQDAISDEVKKIRFIYAYIINDASLGLHNPSYTRSLLDKAEELLDSLE